MKINRNENGTAVLKHDGVYLKLNDAKILQMSQCLRFMKLDFLKHLIPFPIYLLNI